MAGDPQDESWKMSTDGWRLRSWDVRGSRASGHRAKKSESAVWSLDLVGKVAANHCTTVGAALRWKTGCSHGKLL